jgi:class 3 adenylate cyclase
MAERPDPVAPVPVAPHAFFDYMVSIWGTGEYERAMNPDMPWNEEIRATWARDDRLAASPRTVGLMMPFLTELDVRAVLPTIRVPTLVVHHTDDPIILPAWGKNVADHISGAKYVELPGRNMYHFVEPWRDSFQVVAEFLTGEHADVADDRVLATVLFTDIVDSTRRAAEIGDRDWHALLDAHDAVVRVQLNRFRGREVSTSGDGFLAMFDGPQRAIRCAMAIRDAVHALGIQVRAGLHTGECEVRGDDIGGIGVHIGARVSALAGPNDVLVSSTLRDLGASSRSCSSCAPGGRDPGAPGGIHSVSPLVFFRVRPTLLDEPVVDAAGQVSSLMSVRRVLAHDRT